MAPSLLHQAETFDGMTRKLERLPRLDIFNAVCEKIWTSTLENTDVPERQTMKTLIMSAVHVYSQLPERLISQSYLLPDFVEVAREFGLGLLALQHSLVTEFSLSYLTYESAEVIGHNFMCELCLSAILANGGNHDYLYYAEGY
jgi:hypothetical protein